MPILKAPQLQLLLSLLYLLILITLLFFSGNTYLAKTPYLRQFLAYWLEEEKLIDNYNVQHTIHSMSTKEMKRNPEAKGGASPATNASFDPERGYGTSEQKEKIKEQANK